MWNQWPMPYYVPMPTPPSGSVRKSTNKSMKKLFREFQENLQTMEEFKKFMEEKNKKKDDKKKPEVNPWLVCLILCFLQLPISMLLLIYIHVS